MGRGRPVNPSYRYAAEALTAGNFSNLSVIPVVSAVANHQVAAAALVPLPLLSVLDGPDNCTGAIVVSPVLSAAVAAPWTCQSALVLRPTLSAVAIEGVNAAAALSFSPVVSAAAAYHYLAEGAVTVTPVVRGDEYQPGYALVAQVPVIPSLSGTASPGRAATGAVQVVPIVAGALFREFRSAADFTILPVVSANASASNAPPAAWCAGRVHVRPMLTGVAHG